MVMGDAWPRSVLLNHGVRQAILIDWEFAHFGQPGQDVGHVLAHLWMRGHQRGERQRFACFTLAWLRHYELALAGCGALALTTSHHMDLALVHYLAEILARTLGPFVTHEAYRSSQAMRDEAVVHVVEVWMQRGVSSRVHPRDCLLK